MERLAPVKEPYPERYNGEELDERHTDAGDLRDFLNDWHSLRYVFLKESHQLK